MQKIAPLEKLNDTIDGYIIANTTASRGIEWAKILSIMARNMSGGTRKLRASNKHSLSVKSQQKFNKSRKLRYSSESS